MNPDGDMRMLENRGSTPRPARILDTFHLVTAGRRGRTHETDPVVSISCRNSFGSRGGARINLSAAIKRQVDFKESGPRMYVQVFVSASTVKLAFCDKDDEGSRVIAGDGYVSVRELVDWFRLQHGMTYRCKAEVVKGRGREIWATFPPELRERIAALNEVAR